jgi:hypothetical protein
VAPPGSACLGLCHRLHRQTGVPGGYYEYLRSLAFDGDLDFTNERVTWGLPLPAKTPTGLRDNPYAVGCAVFWSPFFALAHGFVLISSIV